ncbi:MAG: M15 family metallopeptidase [Planctomycetaceae bacterium]|nr:M15 family metallopeptidase [Planctomycetaceae bacterium]
MYDAAKAAGITLEAGSGYRSIETQTKLFNDRVRTHMKDSGLTEHQAIMKTNIRVAYPGASEHNLGLCMDFKGGAAFADTESFKWLVANAADFGFILRYPADKTEITGIIYEPWHWRYVGAETAKEIKSKGICLEEYYGKRFISPEESEKLKAKGLNVEDYLRKQGKK